MTTIVFMRHGQAENNTKRILAGRTKGVKLTKLGLEQIKGAAKLAENMNIAAIYSSPIERAHITAQMVGERINITPTVDERLTELEMGQFTGVSFNEIASGYGNVFLKFYKGSMEIKKNGVETFVSVRQRVQSIINEVSTKYENKTVLLVTHMDPIKAALAEAMTLSAELLTRMIIANASMTIFGQTKDKLYMRAINIVESSRYAQDW